MTILELRDKANKLLHDAQQVLLQDVVTPEQRANVNKMLSDVESIESDITNLEKIEARQKEERARTKPARGNPEGDSAVSGDKEERYKKAFADFVTRGENRMSAESRNILFEQRDLLTSNANDAFPIPQAFYPTLIAAEKFVGGFPSAVTRKVTNNNGAPMKIALVNDTANQLVTMTEGVSLADTDPSFSGFILSTDTVATLVKASVQELQDSYFNLDTWLKDAFAVRYARGLDAYIVNGNGSNVQSISSGAPVTVAAASSGPVYNDFVNVYGAQDEAYLPGSKWAMSQATRAYLLGQKDNYGRPLWNVSPNSGTLNQILGCDIVITPNLPYAANNTSTTATVNGVLFGDFTSGYVLRTDGPLTVARLNERYLDSLEIGFIAYSRVGAAVTNAGTSPIHVLQTPIA